MTALDNRELALANVIEHLRGATAEGFLPNDNRGNGSKSWDRSQPPVGGIMVREVYRHYPERWFLEAAFDPLLTWNRWWPTKRLNEGLLSYGSHEAQNPFDEPRRAYEDHRRLRVRHGRLADVRGRAVQPREEHARACRTWGSPASTSPTAWHWPSWPASSAVTPKPPN